MSWNVLLTKVFIGLGLAVVGLGLLLWLDESSILIESLESKTNSGAAVFNKISYQPNDAQDIWLMEQSHQGIKAKAHEWDKIAIVVDKKSKLRAKFYQLMPGPELISMKLKPIGLRASCFLCHSNGPRAIRPNLNSDKAQLSYWDLARVQLWNLRIKSYGPMQSEAQIPSAKKFRMSHPMANTKLKVKSCSKCHNEDGFFARSSLTKQNFMTIKFMLENQFMPPLGFGLTDEERKKIYEFINIPIQNSGS